MEKAPNAIGWLRSAGLDYDDNGCATHPRLTRHLILLRASDEPFERSQGCSIWVVVESCETIGERVGKKKKILS
jgi:1,2-phenylacetyl-CoA epoxidase PaaB subunit